MHFQEASPLLLLGTGKLTEHMHCKLVDHLH